MPETVTPTRFLRLAAALLLLSLPGVVLHGVVAEAAALYPLVDGTQRYFLPEHAGLVYFLVPVAVGSASILFLAPGLFLALAWGRATSVSSWMLSALALSLVLVSLVAGVATGIGGGPVTGHSFGLLCLALLLLTAVIAGWRIRRGPVPWPLTDVAARLVLSLSVAVPLALLIVLAPKFLWESFNGDGAHAFESSRLLVRHALPFWPAAAGGVAAFPGMTSMLFSFPNGWYLRLFGELEASVRFPFLLYLPLLCAAVLAVAEQGRPSLSRGVVFAVWLSLLSFAFAMMYSATYDPYSADVALPATQDTLLLVAFLGWVHALLRRDWDWLGLFTVLTFTASPNGLLLLGFGVLAVAMTIGPNSWGTAARAGAMLVACVVLGTLAPRLLVAVGAPPPGQEHGGAGLLRHFAYLQFTDWKRVAMVVVACGIVPIIGLLRWRRLDPAGRLLTLTTAGLFLFFFVLAHSSLHHFVPAMVLPVAVAGRLWSGELPDPTAWRRAWLLAAAAALVLSLPASFRVQDHRRAVSGTISESVGDYSGSDPFVLRASELLHAILPYDSESSVPDSSFGGSPLVWNHYAQHGTVTDRSNFVLARRGQPAPAGMRILAAEGDAVLYIGSDSLWRALLGLRPPTPAGSRVYAIDRGILFHRPWPLQRGPHIFDTAVILGRLGIDVQPLLARLGVKR